MDQQIRQHKGMAMGEMPEVEGVETPWRCVPDGDQHAASRGLSDSQRAMTKRGKEANHGEY